MDIKRDFYSKDYKEIVIMIINRDKIDEENAVQEKLKKFQEKTNERIEMEEIK